MIEQSVSLATVRARLRWVLFSAVALGTTGYIAAVTVSTLAARELTGSARLAGLPAAAAVVGTALGTALFGRSVATRGRRFGLVVGYAAATAGAGVSVLAVTQREFAMLVAGLVILGFGQSASHLARYTAAELVAPHRRGTAVSLIVWAGTIGAVVGPRLLGPAGAWADRLSGEVYAGGFGVAFVFMLAAELLYIGALRPDPSAVSVPDDAGTPARPEASAGGSVAGSAPGSARAALRLPGVQVALAAMVIGQVVMVLIMTATPIHIEDVGFGLELVGIIISAHTLGMFAFSPLTGWVTDRVGPLGVIAGGAVLLVISAGLSGSAAPEATTQLGIGLFLLGLGWNLGFVAGSALLASTLDTTVRAAVQGAVDAGVWLASATASLGSGLMLAGPGYRSLNLVGAVLVALPVAALALRWRQVAVRSTA